MAEEKKAAESANNMKIIVTFIVALVAFAAIAIFALQQNKNKNETASNSVSQGTSQDTKKSSDDSKSGSKNTSSSKDAGAVGKNEVKFNDNNFQSEVLDYKGVVLVDFYASWCPHCQNIAEDVTAVSDELVGKAKVGKLDVEESTATSKKYEVKGTPTFIIFKNGVEVERVSGERQKDALMSLIKKYL